MAIAATLKLAKFVARKPWRLWSPDARYSCNLCGYSGVFLDKRADTAGGLIHRARNCPRCGSGSRLRLVARYLQTCLPNFHQLAVLHFAPEPAFKRLLPPSFKGEYTTIDPYREDVDVVAPMEATGLPTQSVDLIIANHVLEHVSDDEEAARELQRILRPAGCILLTVPIDWSLMNSWRDRTELSAQERIKLCGASDHVRQYGADFSSLLQTWGFAVDEFRGEQHERQRYGIRNAEDVVFKCMTK